MQLDVNVGSLYSGKHPRLEQLYLDQATRCCPKLIANFAPDWLDNARSKNFSSTAADNLYPVPRSAKARDRAAANSIAIIQVNPRHARHNTKEFSVLRRHGSTGLLSKRLP